MKVNLPSNTNYYLDATDPMMIPHFISQIEKPFRTRTYYNSFVDLFRGVEKISPVILEKTQFSNFGKHTITFREAVDTAVYTSSDTIQGGGEEQKFSGDEVMVDSYRYGIKVRDAYKQKLYQQIDFQKTALQEMIVKNTEIEIRKHFGRTVACFAKKEIGTNIPHPFIKYTIPQFRSLMAAKVTACGLDLDPGSSENISRQRVIFGDDNPAALTRPSIALALNELTVENDGLTVSGLLKARNLADSGWRTATANGITLGQPEDPILPATVSEKRVPYGNDEFMVALMSNETYFSLTKDDKWEKHVYRGTVVSQHQPQNLFWNRFKGTIEGMMIMTDRHWANLDFTIGNKKYGYVQILGAEAFIEAKSKSGSIEILSDPYTKLDQILYEEYTGTKALTTASKSFDPKLLRVERGIIHMFVRLQ